MRNLIPCLSHFNYFYKLINSLIIDALSDFCLNSFKKMSKYMDKTSFEFLLEFLNSEKQHIVKFDDMDVDEEESNSDEDEQQGEEGDDEDQ